MIKKIKKTIAGISVSGIIFALMQTLNMVPPPDETHRGVEIVVKRFS